MQLISNGLNLLEVQAYWQQIAKGSIILIALLIERYKPRAGVVGLGLAGAIAINLSGGIVLALWLIFGDLAISTTGFVLLSTLALVLVSISAIELRAQIRQSKADEAA